jgi:hypothetical protein
VGWHFMHFFTLRLVPREHDAHVADAAEVTIQLGGGLGAVLVNIVVYVRRNLWAGINSVVLAVMVCREGTTRLGSCGGS